ncbi:hypothetical protein Tco_0492018 [Tanacetum coccineum]
MPSAIALSIAKSVMICNIFEDWIRENLGTDVVSYNQRFQELALMCARMFPEGSNKIERYVGGLPDMIHGSVMTSKPKTMQDAIEFATKLMDKKISTFAEREAKNKRKLDKNNQSITTSQEASPAATNNQRNLTCYEYGNQGNYESDFSELKNRNHENQAEGTEARGIVYALGGGETNQDSNNIEDEVEA